MRMRLLPAVGLVLAACTSHLPPAGVPTPADISRLQARAARDPSAEAQAALGAALRASGARDSARVLLERTVAAHPNSGVATLYLGLTYEDLGDYERADSAYRRYLVTGTSPAIKREVTGRLALLQRRQLESAIRNALSQERMLSRQAPAPRTVGIFPFVVSGVDTTLQPLSRALSALLTTDLAQTDRLRVLERTQVQALVDEIKLSGSGLVDPATAVRSGHLLQASRIVQGRVGGGQAALQIAAAVVPVGGPTSGRATPVQVQNTVAHLFDMEKDLAFGLYRSMGIELTVAERERVSHRATENLAALLQFGWGLAAEDAGRWQEAQQYFAKARQLDPGFILAADHEKTDQALATLGDVSTNRVATDGRQEFMTPPPSPPLMNPEVGVRGISLVGLNGVQVLLPDPMVRDPGSELLGLDGITAPATLTIIIRRQ